MSRLPPVSFYRYSPMHMQRMFLAFGVALGLSATVASPANWRELPASVCCDSMTFPAKRQETTTALSFVHGVSVRCATCSNKNSVVYSYTDSPQATRQEEKDRPLDPFRL